MESIPGSPIFLCQYDGERDAARDAMGFGLIPVTMESLGFREIQRVSETLNVYALPALTGPGYRWATGAIQLFSHCKVCAAPKGWKHRDSLLSKPMTGQELWAYLDDAPALRWEQVIRMGLEFQRIEDIQQGRKTA